MSLKFLALLADRPFPYRTADRAEIIHIDTLLAAQLLQGTVPNTAGGQFEGEAVVTAITDLGLILVGRLSSPPRNR